MSTPLDPTSPSSAPVETKPSAIDELDALRLLHGIRDRIVDRVARMLDEDLERIRGTVARGLANGGDPEVLTPYVVREMWNPSTLEYRGLPPVPEEPPASIAWDGPETRTDQ